MKSKFLHLIIAMTLLVCLCTPVQRVQAEAPKAERKPGLSSPENYINPDGTLNLDGSFSGNLDLAGYDVEIDPLHGPVFSPSELPALVPSDEWDGVGDGSGALKGQVYAIAVNGSDVYVGGNFKNAANLSAADYLVKWDGAQWSALGAGVNGDGALTGYVFALAVSGTDLYVGGYFFNVYNGNTYIDQANHIAKWDGANWSALGSNGAGDGALQNGDVEAIVVSGGNVYVGGLFTDVNNNGITLTTADYVAKWDGMNWSALGSNGAANGSINGVVTSLAVSGTDVYIGGSFTNANDNGTALGAADYLAKWDGANWSALGSNGAGNGALNGTVRALGFSGTDLYVGGDFSNVNNNGVPLGAADRIARWDGANWSALSSNGAGDGALNNSVTSLFITGTTVYISGLFTNVNDGGTLLNTADYVAKWDGVNWSALGSNGAGNGSLQIMGGNPIRAIASDGNKVFAGGFFYDVNNNGTTLTNADMIAAWDGADWSGLGGTVNGSLNGYVYAITVHGTDVYVGGSFTDVDNHGTNLTTADYLAKWDGVNWSALGSNGAGNGALNNTVNDIEVIGTDVFISGVFTNVNNNGAVLNAADYIAKWDGMNWSALSSNGGGNGALNGYVAELAMNGTDLYVGGGFTNVTDNGNILGAADYLAKWDGVNWSAVGSDGAGNGSLNAIVQALQVDANGHLYVGGSFTNVNNNGVVLAEADAIAKWDTLTGNWSALGSDGAGNGSMALGSVVHAIALQGTNVYAGGDFSDVNNNGTVLTAADYIVKWDGTDWSALGGTNAGNGTLDGSVLAITVNGPDIYAAGSFFDVRSASGVPLPQADCVARFDGSNWFPLGSNGANNGAFNTWVRALAISGGDLLVGGQFNDVSNSGVTIPEADYLAAYGMPTVPDTTPPTVVSITRADDNPTGATTITFTITFSEVVTGVFTTLDLPLTTTGVNDAYVSGGLNGAGNTRTIQVNTGTGNGTIRLDVADDDSITDLSGNPLGGVGNGNGDFTAGEVYDIDKPVPILSTNTNDGWILESTETSTAGGTKNNAATLLRVGDDTANKQYRSILSFDTSTLPEGAVITSVTLKFKHAGVTGTNPFSTHGKLLVDVCKGAYKDNLILQLGDFNAACAIGQNKALSYSNTKVDNWYSQSLLADYFDLINLEGLTQFRLRFGKDDNNDFGADFLKLFSGEAAEADRPQLVIEYSVP